MSRATEDSATAVTSPLFKIPLELRIEIYCYLLRSPRVICVRNSIHVCNDPPYDFVSLAVVQCKAAERDAIFSLPRLKDGLLQRKPILGKSPEKEIASAILLVSRQTFMEARYIIYSENSFAFHAAECSHTLVEGLSIEASLMEKHQRQHQDSKHAVILTQRPKNNPVEILSIRGSLSCPEPVEFFEHQSRDFRFIRTMIIGYDIVPRIHRSPASVKQEHIFKETCHYISRHLQLLHLTLIVTSDRFAYLAGRYIEEPCSEQFLAKVPQMQWVQCLIPIVTNLRTLHISIPGRELLKNAVMGYLQPKMLKTQSPPYNVNNLDPAVSDTVHRPNDRSDLHSFLTLT